MAAHEAGGPRTALTQISSLLRLLVDVVPVGNSNCLTASMVSPVGARPRLPRAPVSGERGGGGGLVLPTVATCGTVEITSPVDEKEDGRA